MLAADEAGQPPACTDSKRLSDRSSVDRPDLDRLGNALERPAAEVAQASNDCQAAGACRRNRRRCPARQCPASARPGSASRRRCLVPETHPRRSDRRPPPGPSRCRRASGGARAVFRAAHSRDHIQPRAHRPLGIVLVGLRDNRNTPAPRRPCTSPRSRRSAARSRRRTSDRPK